MSGLLIPQSLERIRRQYPGAERLFNNLNVQWAPPGLLHGNQWAEYLRANEPGPPNNPNPFFGRPTVAVNRERIRDPRVLDEVIMGDALHRLPEKHPAIHRQFTSGADPRYLAAMRERHQREGDRRSFEQWRRYSGDDAMIRGYLMRDYPAHREQGGGGMVGHFPYSKQQVMMLKDLERKLKSEPKRTRKKRRTRKGD